MANPNGHRAQIAASVEEFARVVAELADPFAFRRAVLGRYGLTDPEFDQLSATWGGALKADVDLATRFRAAYVERVSSLRNAAQRGHTAASEAPAADPSTQRLRFLNADAQPFRAAAALVPLSGDRRAPPPLIKPDTERLADASLTDVDATLDLPMDASLRTLPFHAVLKPAASVELEDDCDLDATLPLAGAKIQRVIPQPAPTPANSGEPPRPKAAVPERSVDAKPAADAEKSNKHR